MGFLYMALFGTLFMAIGFRPRKPKIIFAHRNRTFLRMFFVISIITVGLPLWLYISGFLFYTELFEHTAWGVWILLALTIYAMLYVLLFSQPTFRGKTRVAGGEEFVRLYARYKDDGGLEVTGLDWVPHLCVDGKRYNLVDYDISFDDEPLAILAFDEHNKVVRDPILMNKLIRCLFFAQDVVMTVKVEERISGYASVSKAVKQITEGLEIYDDLVAPLNAKPGSPTEKHLASVKRGLEITLEYSRLVLEDWELEAQWENERGGIYIKNVDYDEMMALAGQLKAIAYFRDNQDEMREGLRSERMVRQQMGRYKGTRRQGKDLRALLEVVLMTYQWLNDLENWPETGPVIKYSDMTDEMERLWRDRLEWVDQVNTWIAQGITGEALDTKKKKWFEKEKATK